MNAETMGVLAGWTHNEFNGNINLRLQTVHSSRCESKDQVDSHYVMMTRSQAAVLATYLLEVSGQEAHRGRKRGLFERILKG